MEKLLVERTRTRQESIIAWTRRLAFILFFCSIGWVLFVGFGGRDSPHERVMMSTMHCRNSLAINMKNDAEKYCVDALRLVERHSMAGMYAAEAYGQSAVLRIVQGRLSEAADMCRRAIPNWRMITSGPYLEQARNGAKKCERLIADVAARE